MKQCLRMRWEFCPHERDKGILHVGDPLFDSSGDSGVGRAARALQEKLQGFDFPGILANVPEELHGREKELVDSLSGILGVRVAHVRPYMVCISRALVYEWEELTPKIQDVVRSWVGAEEVTVLSYLDCQGDHGK